MHGGAPGSGAPLGNKNALKDGRYTRERIEERRRMRELVFKKLDELWRSIGMDPPSRE
jgi:hypothetical protein